MIPTQDPAILAAKALEDANAFLDAAFNNSDRTNVEVAEKRIDIAKSVFAAASPTTLPGVRCKMDAVNNLLSVCEDGNSLTPDGAAYIRQHIETTFTGLTRPHLVP